MKSRRIGGWLLLIFMTVGCNTKESVAKKSDSPKMKSISSQGDIGPSEKKALDQVMSEAREALRDEDLSTAGRKIADGLEKTENRPGLEILNAQFLLLRGDAAFQEGIEPDARRYYADAMAVFHVHKNDEGSFKTFTALGRLETGRGDFAAAERQFEQAEALKPKIDSRTIVADFLIEKGRLASRKMKSDESVPLYQEAMSVFEAQKDKRKMAEILVMLAQDEDFADRMGEARRALERAVALFDETKDLKGKARALHKLATFAEREQQNAKAERLYSEALTIYESLGNRSAAVNIARRLSTLKSAEPESK
jgi:tetratricopeptide (TPR) repeat protein